MRGWNIMTPALLLLLASGPVAGEPQLGKYLCITDYAAGIFFRPDGTLAAGQITVAPGKQKFFVTIRPADREDRQDCFTKEQGEVLKYEPLPPPTSKNPFPEADRIIHRRIAPHARATDPEQFVTVCLSNFIADVPDHHMHMLDSFDGEEFSNYLPGGKMVFQLFGSSFRLYEESLSDVAHSNDVVSRGRCEFIQAPGYLNSNQQPK
jgi:hypothetical protein